MIADWSEYECSWRLLQSLDKYHRRGEFIDLRERITDDMAEWERLIEATHPEQVRLLKFYQEQVGGKPS